MPRIARKSFDTSFFHIMVQGIKKEHIFYKEKYIEQYIKLLNKYKEEYSVNILAYCVMSNHAHILVYCEKKDNMSDMMHKVNLVYAQNYNKNENRQGYVFRNRYTSEAIYDEKYLLNCINYIHMNPVKANIVSKCENYKFSSYSIENSSQIFKEIFGNKTHKELLEEYKEELFYDIDITERESLMLGINKFERENNCKLKEVLKNTEKLKKLIIFLKGSYKIKYKTMREEFRLSKRKMDNIKRDF